MTVDHFLDGFLLASGMVATVILLGIILNFFGK